MNFRKNSKRPSGPPSFSEDYVAIFFLENVQEKHSVNTWSLVAGAWTEREKMFHGGSFLKLADDNMDIQNPEAQNRELSGF